MEEDSGVSMWVGLALPAIHYTVPPTGRLAGHGCLPGMLDGEPPASEWSACSAR